MAFAQRDACPAGKYSLVPVRPQPANGRGSAWLIATSDLVVLRWLWNQHLVPTGGLYVLGEALRRAATTANRGLCGAQD